MDVVDSSHVGSLWAEQKAKGFWPHLCRHALEGGTALPAVGKERERNPPGLNVKVGHHPCPVLPVALAEQ